MSAQNQPTAAQVAAAATVSNPSAPPPSRTASARERKIRLASRAALEHDAQGAGDRLALRTLRDFAPSSERTKPFFARTLILGLSHPSLGEGRMADVEVALRHSPSRDGDLLLAAWRKGREHNIGLVRTVCASPQRYQTSDGRLLSNEDASCDWSVLGQVVAASWQGRILADSKGVRIDERGEPVFSASASFVYDSKGLRV